jgi:hypothetical protein
MAQTDILNIAQVASSQNQKEVTINDAMLALERALSRKTSITLASGNATLTEDQATRNGLLRFYGHAVARAVTIPATMSNSQPMNRILAIQNDGTSAGAVTIGGSTGTTVVVAIGTVGLIYYDGVNCVAIQAPASTGFYQTLAEKDQVNGYAGLDASGKILIGQIPAGITGALAFQGNWNANTNSPTIVSSTGTLGFYYLVSVAGTTTIDGISSWAVGDQITYNGTAWVKIDNSAGNEKTANKGANSGYAGLDSSGYVSWANMQPDIRREVFGSFVPGKYVTSQTLYYMKTPVAFTLAANLAGSTAYGLVLATASTVISILKNGSVVATITFTSGSNDGVFSTQALISFAIGDTLEIRAPVTPDSTLADLSTALLALRP